MLAASYEVEDGQDARRTIRLQGAREVGDQLVVVAKAREETDVKTVREAGRIGACEIVMRAECERASEEMPHFVGRRRVRVAELRSRVQTA